MDTKQISSVRESATESIIAFYQNLVETTDMSIEEIKNFPPGHDVISDQAMKASAIIGKPQAAMLGFALSGYSKPDDVCYTVVCFMDDADNAKALANEVHKVVATIEEHHARMN